MKMRLVVLVLGCLLLCQLNAFAQIGAKRDRFFSSNFEVTPFVGGLVLERDLEIAGFDLDNSVIFGARAAININHNWGIEGTFGYSPANTDVPANVPASLKEVNILLTQVDLVFNLAAPMHRRMVPFMTFGLNAYHFDEPGTEGFTSELGFDIGGGLKLFFNDFVAVRADIVYSVIPGVGIVASRDRETGILFISGGVSFFFDRAFSGRDYVIREELIDNTLAKKDRLEGPDDKVSVSECEQEILLAEGQKPIHLVSRDSDGDAVNDNSDKCPDTPLGMEVDPDGCPIIISQIPVILDNVYFEANTTEITQELAVVLNMIAKALLNNPKAKLEIRGYTDSVGSEASNLILSQKRADTVRSFLIFKGIDQNRLIARGYGEANPISSNKTEEGRAKNRRVELHRID